MGLVNAHAEPVNNRRGQTHSHHSNRVSSIRNRAARPLDTRTFKRTLVSVPTTEHVLAWLQLSYQLIWQSQSSVNECGGRCL